MKTNEPRRSDAPRLVWYSAFARERERRSFRGQREADAVVRVAADKPFRPDAAPAIGGSAAPGAVVPAAAAQYAARYGLDLSANEERTVVSGGRRCPECGEPVPDGDMFCHNCGGFVG